jgi:hypothetical protein
MTDNFQLRSTTENLTDPVSRLLISSAYYFIADMKLQPESIVAHPTLYHQRCAICGTPLSRSV